MSITLSNTSMPSTASCSPGFVRCRCSLFANALWTISLTSVDFPEPDTPVTTTNFPTGNDVDLRDRELDVDVLQIVLGRPPDPERAVILGAALGHRNHAPAGKE